MVFSVREKDLAGRIGELVTRTGRLETPALLPVVNPVLQIVSPEEMKQIGFQGVMTNAYIVKRHWDRWTEKKIHAILDFDGVIMADSGAYQLLRYGEIELSPTELVRLQEEIEPDIAVILDVPTGWDVDRGRAEYTVMETLRRAELTAKIRKKSGILWVCPIQGGTFLDLVRKSAVESSKLNYDAYALGSPTRVMEEYDFATLVEMIATARFNIPMNKPLHLFGAGHPMMFAMAVALGCDTFDSASYALYAKDGRYMVEHGTLKVERMEYLPCDCPVCRKRDVEDFKEGEAKEKLLALHNLYKCYEEIERIKEAISEGRLWELIKLRSFSHPALRLAFKKLLKYVERIARYTPSTKDVGLFIFDEEDLQRPEILIAEKRMLERYSPPRREFLVILPPPPTKPYLRDERVRILLKEIEKKGLLSRLHVCFLSEVFGVVPYELSETYPFSQHEVGELGFSNVAKRRVLEYLRAHKSFYKQAIVAADLAEVAELVEEAGLVVHKIPFNWKKKEIKRFVAVFENWARRR